MGRRIVRSSWNINFSADLRQRQPNRERRALAFFAVHADRAVVRFDDRFGDVEAEAEAAVVAAGDVARAVEALEELRDLVASGCRCRGR